MQSARHSRVRLLSQNELLMQDLGKRMETMVYNLGDSHFFYNDLEVSWRGSGRS